MARLIAAAGPCTLQPRPERSPFEALARAIAHQQLNGTAAERILGRFTALYAPASFPAPAQLQATADSALRASGFSHAKIRALRDLADKVLAGVVPPTPELCELADDAIVERLTQVRGIGRWTVEMLLISQLGRADVLPVDDFGVRNGFRLAYGLKGMPTPRALAGFGARWAPHRSCATWYLWRAVDLSRLDQLPRPGRAPRLALSEPRVARAKPPAARTRRPALSPGAAAQRPAAAPARRRPSPARSR